jgi:hypothetical protein
MSIDLNKKIGPYVGLSKDETRKFPKLKVRIILYGAYNAMGLIGSECNGIVILNDTKRQVVLDEHCRISSGWFGPDNSQIAEFNRIMALSEADLIVFCRSHKRYREGSI